jgi:flagellar biosynthesis anti-sigma factor FlgM
MSRIDLNGLTGNVSGGVNGSGEAESARQARRVEAARDQEFQQAASAGNSDALSFSERGAKVAALVERITELPDVRSERVERLSRLIGQGAYQPPARDIADALLRNE